MITCVTEILLALVEICERTLMFILCYVTLSANGVEEFICCSKSCPVCESSAGEECKRVSGM